MKQKIAILLSLFISCQSEISPNQKPQSFLSETLQLNEESSRLSNEKKHLDFSNIYKNLNTKKTEYFKLSCTENGYLKGKDRTKLFLNLIEKADTTWEYYFFQSKSKSRLKYYITELLGASFMYFNANEKQGDYLSINSNVVLVTPTKKHELLVDKYFLKPVKGKRIYRKLDPRRLMAHKHLGPRSGLRLNLEFSNDAKQLFRNQAQTFSLTEAIVKNDNQEIYLLFNNHKNKDIICLKNKIYTPDFSKKIKTHELSLKGRKKISDYNFDDSENITTNLKKTSYYSLTGISAGIVIGTVASLAILLTDDPSDIMPSSGNTETPNDNQGVLGHPAINDNTPDINRNTIFPNPPLTEEPEKYRFLIESDTYKGIGEQTPEEFISFYNTKYTFKNTLKLIPEEIKTSIKSYINLNPEKIKEILSDGFSLKEQGETLINFNHKAIENLMTEIEQELNLESGYLEYRKNYYYDFTSLGRHWDDKSPTYLRLFLERWDNEATTPLRVKVHSKALLTNLEQVEQNFSNLEFSRNFNDFSSIENDRIYPAWFHKEEKFEQLASYMITQKDEIISLLNTEHKDKGFISKGLLEYIYHESGVKSGVFHKAWNLKYGFHFLVDIIEEGDEIKSVSFVLKNKQSIIKTINIESN